MSQRTPRKISKAEIRCAVDEGIKANDLIRTTGLENLLRLRSKKANLQQREQQRLTAKYGASDQRVQQVNNNLETNANYIGGLRMELTRAKTPVIKPAANAWCVQGYVYDRQAIPIPNAKMALYSADGKEVAVVEATTTDTRGYYRLDHAPRGVGTTGDQILDSSSDSVLAGAEDTGAGGGIRTNIGATPDPAAASETTGTERLSEGLRINTNENARASVFVRALDPQDPELCADSTLITPRAGVCSYRDITIDTNAFKPTDTKDRRTTRYLGNSATRELHDLKNEKKRCQIDAIRFDHCTNFNTQKEAVAADYDFCAYCFSKAKSKR
jgi:hypothetical protein